MRTERSSIRHIGLGTVLIGREPVAPAGAVVINLPGAVLDVDPARPDLVPSCLVGDIDLAISGVKQIFGRAVAKGLLDVVSEEGTESGIYQVRGGEVLGLLRGLAEIRWCRDNSDLLLDSLLLELEELTLLGRLSGRIEVDREWRKPLLALLGCLTQSPERLSRIHGHPVAMNLLLEASDVLAGPAILDPAPVGRPPRNLILLSDKYLDPAPVGRPEVLRYALAAGGVEPEDEESEDIEPCPPPGSSGERASEDARCLTAQGVFDLRLYVITGERGLLETGLSALEAATETWRASGARAEAAAVRDLLDLAREPDFPANWPVRPSVAEQVHACPGAEPGRRSSVRWP